MRHRSTLAEAREARYTRYLASTCPPTPRPTGRELGPFESHRAWQYQFRLQYGRCATCGKLATSSRRLHADRFRKLRCPKCWWGVGNVEVGPITT